MKYHDAAPSALPPARKRAALDYSYAFDLSREPVKPDPSPEFGREIVATHRELVREAAAVMGADADAISEVVCLPVWNVRRALFAMGLGPDPRPTAAAVKLVSVTRVGKAHKWLKRHGPATARQVAEACGFRSSQSASSTLRQGSMFREASRVTGATGRAQVLWEAC